MAIIQKEKSQNYYEYILEEFVQNADADVSSVSLRFQVIRSNSTFTMLYKGILNDHFIIRMWK